MQLRCLTLIVLDFGIKGKKKLLLHLKGIHTYMIFVVMPLTAHFFFGAWSSENRIHSVYMFDRLDADIINLEFSSITEISSVSCNPTLSNLLAVGTVNGLISIIDIETREIISTIELSENSTPVEITDLEWNQTGDMLGVGLNEGNVVVYSFNQQSEN
jgi:WD40 repeat protein